MPRHRLLHRSRFSLIKKSILASCLIQATVAGNSCATSIVCVRSPDSIVIAADSMLTVRNGKATSVSSTECKILRSGRYFFSLSGFYKDPVRNYDVIRIVSDALDEELPFSDNEDLVVDEMTSALTAELVRLKSELPAAFNGIKSRGGTLLNLLFTGFQDGTSHVALLKFKLGALASGEIALTVERNACPGDCNAQNIKAFYLTDMKAINAYLKMGHTVDWRSPEKAAKFLVNLVIEAHTPGVAAPIDLLRIDKTGASWVEHKAQCPELTDPPRTD